MGIKTFLPILTHWISPLPTSLYNVRFVTLPWANAADGHIIPVGSQIVKEINKGFNPYAEDISLDDLQLVTLDDMP